MIKSIRGRLQWWYGAVYALSIILFGSLVYWRADRDVHERAALQAVSTVQYLDVSLRGIHPGAFARVDEPESGDQPGEQLRDPLLQGLIPGPLPPEFQFRPPRDSERQMPPDQGNRPFPRRPDLDQPFEGRPGEMRDPRPFRRDGQGRGPEGPGWRGPMGPPRERVDSIRSPSTAVTDPRLAGMGTGHRWPPERPDSL